LNRARIIEKREKKSDKMKRFWSILGLVTAYRTYTGNDCPGECRCFLSSDTKGVYVDCKQRGLAEIPEVFPERTKKIDLSQNSIKFINEMPDLSELTLLNLTSNDISDIHYDAFDGLDSLETLVLSHNKLSAIDDDIFEWNPLKLKHIFLDNNRFEYIQHFLFYDLTDLEEIDLSNNLLNFVHTHAFTVLTNLRKLDLSNNHLNTFSSKWVKPLLDSSLVNLNLGGNPWQCDCTLEETITSFFGDDQYKSLFHSAVFRGKGNFVCEDSQKDITKITTKDLKKCQAPTITGISKSFTVDSGKSLLLKCIAEGQPKPSIEWRAPNDDVFRLTSDDFEGVTVHQDGSVLIEDIRNSDEGDYHCVAKNNQGSKEAKVTITVTGDDTIDRDEMDDEFDDSKWNIDNEEWEDVDDLEWDDKRNEFTANKQSNSWKENDLEGFDDDDILGDDLFESFNHKNVEDKDCPKGCDCNSDVVDCSDAADMDVGKAFTYIPQRIPHTAVHLDMNVNSIQRVDKYVCKNYQNLQELKLDDNLIKDIHPDAFKYCKDLRILTLRNNKITSLKDGLFADLNKVQILVLDNNGLEELPDNAFAGMDDLEYLYIRENKIKTIKKYAFYGLDKLRFIHLEENRIETLDKKWIEEAAKNKNLKRIFLEDNSLNCDSNMKEFKDDFKSAKDDRQETNLYRIIQPADLRCSYPIEQAGKSLDELDFEALVIIEPPMDQGSGSNAGLLIGGIFLGIVLTALIFVVWRKWNRGHSLRRQGLYSYQDINQEDGESRALTADQEAFI